MIKKIVLGFFVQMFPSRFHLRMMSFQKVRPGQFISLVEPAWGTHS